MEYFFFLLFVKQNLKVNDFRSLVCFLFSLLFFFRVNH
jgi:hypothetical protein